MKKLLLLAVFISLHKAAKSQCIFIYASEKIKGVEIPLERQEFDVVISDTIKKHATSFADGSLGRMALPPGTYTVRLHNPEYQDATKTEVIVKESHTTNVIIDLYRTGVKLPPEEKK
jgi:hypothetical protein